MNLLPYNVYATIHTKVLLCPVVAVTTKYTVLRCCWLVNFESSRTRFIYNPKTRRPNLRVRFCIFRKYRKLRRGSYNIVYIVKRIRACVCVWYDVLVVHSSPIREA